MSAEKLLLLVVVALTCAASVWLLLRFCSPEARLERRRRRSNCRIANKGRRPLVRFSVRTKKD